MMLTLADVFEALTNSRPAGATAVITEAAVDSRQVIPGGLFVALVGERVDGHDYVNDAFKHGASYALVDHEVSGEFHTLDLTVSPVALDPADTYAGPLCLRVSNSLAALQQLARFWRSRLDLKVIGITGSVGKSTTKEAVADVLNTRYRTLKSPGNLNNEIGLPLSVLKLGPGFERAVLEMGFYVPGEIAFLCEIARPQIGVVTNIGTVHAERAGSQEAIFQGKSELVQALPADGTAILNYDDPWVRKMADLTSAQVFFYGLDPQANLWADNVESMGLDGIRFELHSGRETLHVHLPMIGQHSVHTALRAAAVGLVDGLTWQEILDGLRMGQTQLRLTIVRAVNGALVLDDTYNASPESTLAALNLLSELEGHKVAVLGDMLELGPYEKAGHEMVGARAAQVAEQLVTIGIRGRIIAAAARQAGMRKDRVKEFESTDAAIPHLTKTLTDKDVVLVKGSHGVHMERIVSALEGSK
jgi:UDP-N-acetylmuramoyl-tripeptide--D-alanyl-D-alanine ligase